MYVLGDIVEWKELWKNVHVLGTFGFLLLTLTLPLYLPLVGLLKLLAVVTGDLRLGDERARHRSGDAHQGFHVMGDMFYV